MCKYCEKGKVIKVNGKDVKIKMNIIWDDCLPVLNIDSKSPYFKYNANVSIVYCPWCGRKMEDFRNKSKSLCYNHHV